MSCWVCPSLAAELWHMPLDQVLAHSRDGQIASRHEDGFTFVEMAPFGPHLHRPSVPRHLRPPTFTAAAPGDEPQPLSDDEIGSLTHEPPPAAIERDPEQSKDLSEDSPEDLPEDETASKDLGDWRSARRKASRLRIPPPRRAVI